jgi:hypothetical protein
METRDVDAEPTARVQQARQLHRLALGAALVKAIDQLKDITH